MNIIWHKHHLKPKHMGGDDSPQNIVRVNIAMHAFLHKLLWEEHGCWQDYLAWKALSGQITHQEATRMAQVLGDKEGKSRGGKIAGSMKKPPISEERRAKLRMCKNFKGKKHTPETKEKMRLAKLGVPRSEETKKKIGDFNRGRKRPPEMIERVRKARWGK